jgi:hypothetical protein
MRAIRVTLPMRWISNLMRSEKFVSRELVETNGCEFMQEWPDWVDVARTKSSRLVSV